MTASILFAGSKHKQGVNRCYYCGADCDETYPVGDFVKDTFTNRDIVAFPGSSFVCEGCAESLGVGDDEMLMLDGSTKVRENARGMQPRMYSWILSEEKRIAATKAHISLLRSAILEPPAPPFSIILADSGQKQLIFRAPVAMARNDFPVMLEDEVIGVNIELLKSRIALALPIAAALGKPALTGDIGFSSYTRYEQYHGNIDGLEAWEAVKHQPISRLAAWLSKSKEDAQNECPAIERRGIPAEARGISGPVEEASGIGIGGDKRGSDQIMFDLR